MILVSTSMANVVVLIPPAVPPGDPPMNINRHANTLDSVCSAAWDTVANPAVLVVTDWNNAAMIFSPGFRFPMVPGL